MPTTSQGAEPTVYEILWSGCLDFRSVVPAYCSLSSQGLRVWGKWMARSWSLGEAYGKEGRVEGRADRGPEGLDQGEEFSGLLDESMGCSLCGSPASGRPIRRGLWTQGPLRTSPAGASVTTQPRNKMSFQRVPCEKVQVDGVDVRKAVTTPKLRVVLFGRKF